MTEWLFDITPYINIARDLLPSTLIEVPIGDDVVRLIIQRMGQFALDREATFPTRRKTPFRKITAKLGTREDRIKNVIERYYLSKKLGYRFNFDERIKDIRKVSEKISYFSDYVNNIDPVIKRISSTFEKDGNSVDFFKLCYDLELVSEFLEHVCKVELKSGVKEEYPLVALCRHLLLIFEEITGTNFHFNFMQSENKGESEFSSFEMDFIRVFLHSIDPDIDFKRAKSALKAIQKRRNFSKLEI